LGPLIRHYGRVLEELGWVSRPAIDEAIEAMDSAWGEKDVFLIEAPTGYGKTAVSLAIARYSLEEEAKAIIAYPLRTLLEDQVGRFRQLFGGVVGVRYMLHPESPYLVKPVTLTTIDTLALNYVGLAAEDLGKVMKHYDGTATRSLGHYLFSRASVLMSNVVIDEAHLVADLPNGPTVLAAIARTAAEEGMKLVLMTATAPKQLRNLLTEVVGEDRFLHIPFRARSGDPFVEEREAKEYSVEARPVRGVEEVVEWVEGAGEGLRRRKALLVFNTVREAVKAYDALNAAGGWLRGAEKVLIHSRFASAHREALVDKLKQLESGERDYVVVATQVVEAGVDITSNIFASDAAPPTSLIQRAGRFLRREECCGEALLWWSADDSGNLETREADGALIYKVYPARLVEETIKWIRSGCPGLHLPDYTSRRAGYRVLIDRAYEGVYRVAHNLLSAILDITKDFSRGSIRAAELMTELGGSLLRDGVMAPLIPKALLERGYSPRDASVPVSAHLVASLIRKGLVGECLMSDGSIRPLDPWVALGRRTRRSGAALASFMSGFGVVGFVTSLGYDEVRGLALQ